MIHKHTLYRGVPYSGLDLDDLEGRGGYGQQMLGSGLYATDDYYVAKDYAQSESPRFRDYDQEDKPCVYELELAIPSDEILNIDADSIAMCEVDESSAIPSIFGVPSPAFEFQLKDRATGKMVTYLISEYEDPLEYAKDLKLECANEVLDWLGLGEMSSFVEFGEYLDENLYNCEEDEEEYEEEERWRKDACETFEELVRESGGDVDAVIDRIQKQIDDRIREESGLPNYGKYGEVPDVNWGGDSTDLAYLAGRHGYKVLWCSGWIASGDEVLIVDDSIYDNGLSIVDDCTDD